MTQTNKKLKQKLFYLQQGLQGDKLEQLYNSDALLVPALLKAMQDSNEQIVKRAEQILLNLKQTEAQQALCQFVLENNHPLATKTAIAAGYLPQTIAERALFYFLTQQWERYDDLDFDHRLLKLAYSVGNEATIRRIADAIRASGRVELLEIIADTQYGSQLTKLSKAEWSLMIELMEKGARYQELWELALLAPAYLSFQILKYLASIHWQPSQADEQIGYDQLNFLVANCETAYPPTVQLLNFAYNLENSNRVITHLAISPDNKLLASAYDNEVIELWSLETNQVINTFQEQFQAYPKSNNPENHSQRI